VAYDFSSDLEMLFDTDELAKTATYTRSGYPSVLIPVIFESPGANAPLAGGMEYETASPKVLCRTADVLNVAHGDTVTVDAKVYKVIGVSPDGTGITTLTLSED
jgi:hypothetical protein